MKYVVTMNGKKYEVEVERMSAFHMLTREEIASGVSTPVQPVAAPAPKAAAPTPAAAAPADPRAREREARAGQRDPAQADSSSREPRARRARHARRACVHAGTAAEGEGPTSSLTVRCACA